jgi:hypothetical protein
VLVLLLLLLGEARWPMLLLPQLLVLLPVGVYEVRHGVEPVAVAAALRAVEGVVKLVGGGAAS